MTEKPKVIICGIVFYREEKEPYVRSGKSLQGVQEYDSEADAIKCHECGAWFTSFGGHLRSAHGLTKREYKIRHSLPASARMMAPGFLSRRKEHLVKRLGAPEGIPPWLRAVRTPEANARRAEACRAAAVAKRNLAARCDAQLKARVMAIYADLGHVPSKHEFRSNGVNLDHEARIRGKRFSEFLGELGLDPRPAYQKLEPAVLIELLRDFYVLNRRLPKSSEYGIGGLPSKEPFRKRFGSMQAAYEAAGLGLVATTAQAA